MVWLSATCEPGDTEPWTHMCPFAFQDEKEHTGAQYSWHTLQSISCSLVYTKLQGFTTQISLQNLVPLSPLASLWFFLGSIPSHPQGLTRMLLVKCLLISLCLCLPLSLCNTGILSSFSLFSSQRDLLSSNRAVKGIRFLMYPSAPADNVWGRAPLPEGHELCTPCSKVRFEGLLLQS